MDSASAADATTPDEDRTHALNPSAANLYSTGELPAEVVSNTAYVTDITGQTGDALSELLPAVDDDLAAEEPRWAHFPWRSALVKVPGPRTFRRLRLDRNRHKLTADQQEAAAQLRVGIVGLSVGHAIALTLALEGLAGEMRLADFDPLELTNLNRVPATLLDLQTNKATVAARRLAEIDPYLTTKVFDEGVTAANIDEFLDGLDLVIEECDSFDVKVLVREKARALGIPVLMETSDGGTLDVERYDLEPDRPLFHGLVGDLRGEDLAGLDRAEITPLAVRVLEPARVTAPMAASAIELGHTVTAWPQLGGDVLLGGSTVAAAVRRLVQGRPLPSGRVRLDRDAWLDGLEDPAASASSPTPSPDRADEASNTQADNTSGLSPQPDTLTDLELIAHAAVRAPSAGNQQPWQITVDDDAATVTLDPARTSTLDVRHRASAVAVGAALYNVRVAAASRGLLGASGTGLTDGVEIASDGDSLSGRIPLSRNGTPPPEAATELDAVLARSTRRAPGDASTLTVDELASLNAVAATELTRLVPLAERDDIGRYASIISRSDRVRFLTPELHGEMFEELTADPAAPEGIDVASLDLPPAMAGMIDVLRRADVMALLDSWDAGAALGADGADRVESASAILLLAQRGRENADFVRAGMVAEALWVRAEQLGFAVHPMTPTFLYADDAATARKLSSNHGDELADLRAELLDLCRLDDGEVPTIVLRLSRTTKPVVRSRRIVHPPQAHQLTE